MSIRTFWSIFLKILGLRLITYCMAAIATVQVYATAEYEQGNVGEAILIFVTVLSTYLLIMLTLIFKSNWIINLLRLDLGFDEDRISLEISSNTVLRMATIVLGGIMLIEVFPDILRDIATFYNGSIFADTSAFWTNLIRAILGLLLMTQHKLIVAFITKKANE